MAFDFQPDDDKLDFQVDFQPEEEEKHKHHALVQPLVDLGDQAIDFLHDVGSRIIDPSTYSGAFSAAKEGLGEAGKLAGNLVTGGATPPSGGQEVVGNLASGMAGFAAAPVPAAMQSINNLTQGQPANFEQNYANAADRMTYQPKSELGQQGAGIVGDFINNVGIPMMGHMAMPEPSAALGDALLKNDRGLKSLDTKAPAVGKAEINERLRWLQDTAVDKSRQDMADALSNFGDKMVMDKVREASDAQFSTELKGELQDLGIQTRLKELSDQIDKTGQDPATAKASITDFLRNENDSLVIRLKGIDDHLSKAEDAVTISELERKKSIADFMRKENDNLIERLQHLDDLASGLEDFNARYANDTLLGKLSELEARRGEQPIFVDPQGEAFRGDPRDPTAILAHTTEQNAAYKDMVHLQGTQLKEGNPLSTLGDPTMDQYRQQAHEQAAGMPQSPSISSGADLTGIKPTRVRKGQRGGVTLDLLTLGLLPKSNPLKKLSKSKDATYIPEPPSPEQLGKLLEKARTEKDGRSFKNMDSGAQLTAMKRGSTAIQALGDIIEGAYKRADLQIRQIVFPAEQALRETKMTDLNTLGEIFKKEMFKGEQFSKDALAVFSPELQNAYRKMREGFNESLRVQNEGRAAKGQKPITAQEAYLSSRWSGDFRRPLYDAKGKLVWYLASDTKMGLDAQTRSVLKDNPEYIYDPKKDHVVRFKNRKTDLESAYTTMIDILGRDDPAVAKLQTYMENQVEGRGATFLNQEKHFKGKGNVRGFVGDRPTLHINDFFDSSVPVIGEKVLAGDKKSETLSMFQQQIQYMKNGIRWSELQKVADPVKQLLTDPELRDSQPKNSDYMRDYWKHSIGYGESEATRAISDSLRDFGLSPEPFDRGVGGLKSFFILDKLAASAGYVMTQGIQLGMIVPHMVDAAVKGRFVSNPLKAVASGLLGGLTMGTGHMFNAMSGKMRFDGVPGADFFNAAYKYAEDNGITARSIYDESPIRSSFTTTGKVAALASKTLTVPETYIRSAAFMTMAQFLKDSGKYKNEADVFKEAERRTNVAMVDYAQVERPMIFAKLGSMGNFLNTLQTYSWNYYNQMSYFSREASKGNVMPLMAFMSIQYLMAGAMGIPFVEDAHKALMALKDALPAKYWKKIQENEFLSEPKLWLLKHGGTSAVYGYLADKTGLGLTSRLAAPSVGQGLSSPVGPIMDVAKQAGSALGAVTNPGNSTKVAQAAMDLTPPGVQGLLETSDLMKGHTHNETRPDGTTPYVRPSNLENREALVNRTPKDETIRKFGLRSTREMEERDINYANKRDSMTAQKHITELPNKFYDAVRRGDLEDAKDYYKTYVWISGKGISKDSFNKQIEQEFFTDSERGAKNAKQSLQAMLNAKRAKDLFDKIKSENPTNEDQ